jgi:GNAT superfamily N-acetyltransferase
MDNLVIAVRTARPDDAQDVARIYIDAWHDTYPAILPTDILCAMTPRGQTARWRATILARGRERVLVAESAEHGPVGMISFGPAQDAALGFEGEIFTLYVDPGFFGRGVGSALMQAGFDALHGWGLGSCLVWAHARNPARYFYEAKGGRLIAERSRRMMGSAVPEAAFGWRALVLTAGREPRGGNVSPN